MEFHKITPSFRHFECFGVQIGGALFCLWGLCSALHAHVNVHIDVLFSYGFMVFLCFSSICKLSFRMGNHWTTRIGQPKSAMMRWWVASWCPSCSEVTPIPRHHHGRHFHPFPLFRLQFGVSWSIFHFHPFPIICDTFGQIWVFFPWANSDSSSFLWGFIQASRPRPAFFPVRKWLFKMHPLFVCQTPKRIVRRTCNRLKSLWPGQFFCEFRGIERLDTSPTSWLSITIFTCSKLRSEMGMCQNRYYSVLHSPYLGGLISQDHS